MMLILAQVAPRLSLMSSSQWQTMMRCVLNVLGPNLSKVKADVNFSFSNF